MAYTISSLQRNRRSHATNSFVELLSKIFLPLRIHSDSITVNPEWEKDFRYGAEMPGQSQTVRPSPPPSTTSLNDTLPFPCVVPVRLPQR